MKSYFLQVRIIFQVVMYLDIPGTPLSLCSVHSKITCTLLPFAFFAITNEIKQG